VTKKYLRRPEPRLPVLNALADKAVARGRSAGVDEAFGRGSVGHAVSLGLTDDRYPVTDGRNRRLLVATKDAVRSTSSCGRSSSLPRRTRVDGLGAG
jgi:hypothetical protein